MSETANQIQIYQETVSDHPGLVIKVATFETVQHLPPPLINNPINDTNPLMLNLEVFLVAFLLLALPILIYLAYRYGKKMGRKENGPVSKRPSGGEPIARRLSQESTSSNSWCQIERNNSKHSSTSSSPALVPMVPPRAPADKDSLHSSPATSENNKRELSLPSEDEKFEDFSLSEPDSCKNNQSLQVVPVENNSLNHVNNENFNVMYTYSCGALGGENRLEADLFDEKVKLHSQEGQVMKKEVKLGINVEKKGEHFQKTETKEVRTIYNPQEEGPKQKAMKMREDYESSPLFNKIFTAPPAVEQLKIPLSICAAEEPQPAEPTKPESQGMVSKKSSEIVANKESTNHETKDDRTKTSVEPTMIESIVEKYGVPDETGKFHKIFKDVEWIGEGSFGEVYKVIHRLDGKNYAVKKVKLKLGRFEELKKESKVFREVFAMTDLHHPNIVRYSTCWVEIEWDKGSQELKDAKEKVEKPTKLLSEPLNLGDISENEDSEEELSDNESPERSRNSDLGFEWDVSEKEKTKKKDKSRAGKLRAKKKNEEKTPRLKRISSTLLIRTLSRSFIEEEVEEMSKNSSLSRVESMSEVPGCKLYLYIQMEYCEGQSLKYYLENSNRIIVEEKVLQMFRKLLEGVYSIHTRGILHRDLKPANIFLDGKENIKIGDFGLASLDKYEEQPQLEGLTPRDKGGFNFKNRKLHSLKVGTPMYTSPEQESGVHYDHKTDIYSLGLIFYEMLVKFSTNHERYEHFGRIRDSHELPSKFKKTYPAESEIILKMTHQSPTKRPSADQLIKEVDKLLEAKQSS